MLSRKRPATQNRWKLANPRINKPIYQTTDKCYKTVPQLIHYLVNAAGRNANFLLNVGPMPNGKIQQEFIDTLQKIGKWLQLYGQTIYDTRGNIASPQNWGVITGKNKTLYVHIMEVPSQQSYIFIPGLKEQIISASLLSDKSKIKFTLKSQQKRVI